VSEKSTRNNLDYTVESRRRGIAPFFDRNSSFALAIRLKSLMIRANQD